jgi:hypothetical protein
VVDGSKFTDISLHVDFKYCNYITINVVYCQVVEDNDILWYDRDGLCLKAAGADAMTKDDKPLNLIEYGEFLSRLVVGIGEVAEITGVPQRQIRYWQDKGIIQAVVSRDSSTRRYDYLNIKKILLIKQLLDEGYTLDAAAAKVEKSMDMVQAALAKLIARS